MAAGGCGRLLHRSQQVRSRLSSALPVASVKRQHLLADAAQD